MAAAAPDLPALARDRAFETLYRRYVKDVYHYALALLRNPADAEDVTQTTFMNAYRAFQRGEEIRKPQHWLIKIAHNVARSRYARASRRVKEVPLDDHLGQLAVPESEKPDVEAVLDALAGLPLNQRAALVMRELEGRTYAEIADTIGVSVAAVETLIFRARRSLRLKASAVRVLSAVPVPTSLARLFDTGAVVVGGGSTLAGGGFLLKAAVAIVAGAVATGVGGGGRTHDPSLALPPSLAHVSGAAAGQTAAVLRLTSTALRAGTAGTALKPLPRAPAAGGSGTTLPQLAAAVIAHAPQPSPGTAQVAPLPAPTTVTTTARSAATSTAGTVGAAASGVTGSLPVPPVTIPAALPQLPPLPPIQPPALP